MGRVVAAAVYSAGKKVTNISLDEGATWAAKPGHFVWIGLEHPGLEELTTLQRQFNLHELAIEDALEVHSRPKLETFGDALFIVTYAPIRENGKLIFIETHIFAGKGYVITSRNGDSKSYGAVRQRCEARPLLLEHGEDFVLYALLTSSQRTTSRSLRPFTASSKSLSTTCCARTSTSPTSTAFTPCGAICCACAAM